MRQMLVAEELPLYTGSITKAFDWVGPCAIRHPSTAHGALATVDGGGIQLGGPNNLPTQGPRWAVQCRINAFDEPLLQLFEFGQPGAGLLIRGFDRHGERHEEGFLGHYGWSEVAGD